MTSATLGLIALLASPPTDSTASAGGSPILAYQGVWNVDLTYRNTPYGKARHDRVSVRNSCWQSDEYVACHQYANGKSAGLVVYTAAKPAGTFVTHVVPMDGSAASAGKLVIAGNVWTYPWTQPAARGTVDFRIVNVFVDRRTIAFRQEYSTDRRHWQTMATGREHKIR